MARISETVGMGAALAAAAYALFSLAHIDAPVAAPAAETTPAAQAEAPATVAAVKSEAPAPAANVATAQVAQAETPAAAAPAAGPDAAAGEKVFAKCKSCHSVAEGKNGVGPSLYGVVNRAVASIANFKYSDAMKAKGGAWTPKDLDAYLANPKAAVPGNKMTFAGLPQEPDRINVIAYLAQNSATPIAPTDLGLGTAAAAGAAAAASTAAPAAAAPAAEAPAAVAPAVTYTDPPPPSEEQVAASNAAVEKLKAELPSLDYQRARYYPLHFKPAIDKASDAECLVCHAEVLGTNVREKSLAGVEAAKSLAWYQTLATYDGAQATFHQRHASTPYAKAVMNLNCTFCHQGNDPREESPTMTVAPADMTSNNGKEPFTNRKMVNPSETCLRCHGAMPDPVNIMGLPGPFPEVRKDLETAETPNACLTCHQDLFRTNRHNVTYLNAATIEDLAKEGSDVCYGCHGGRQWYRISYPYPRHPWPGMDTSTTPDWAKGRPTDSDARYIRHDGK